MGFNYGKERRQFEAEWVKLRLQYREAGFPEDKIDAMYAFDEEVFRQRRNYENRNQPLPLEDFGEDDSENRTSLFGRFESLAVSFDDCAFAGRFDWVDTISDATLVSRLKKLSQEDLELLTLFAIDGYSQPQIARLEGCNQSTVSRKLTRIQKFLRKI